MTTALGHRAAGDLSAHLIVCSVCSSNTAQPGKSFLSPLLTTNGKRHIRKSRPLFREERISDAGWQIDSKISSLRMRHPALCLLELHRISPLEGSDVWSIYGARGQATPHSSSCVDEWALCGPVETSRTPPSTSIWPGL